MHKLGIPTIFTVCALPILLYLGTWQLQRLEWKTSLIAQRDNHFKEVPLKEADLKENITTSSKTDLEFRQITLTGIYLHKHEVRILSHTRQGKAGFHVVTPFKIASDPTLILLINRGWVANKTEYWSRPPGKIFLKGVVRYPETAQKFVPPNKPPVWFTIDIPLILKSVGNSVKSTPFYIQEIKSSDDFPLALDPYLPLINNHLSYALTWYSFAIILVIIYGRIVYRYRKIKDDGANYDS